MSVASDDLKDWGGGGAVLRRIVRRAYLSNVQVFCSHQDVGLLATKTDDPWENESPTK